VQDRRPDDVLTDEAYEVWRKARTRDARAVAMTNLLRAAEPFIGRIVRHFSRGQLRDLDSEEAMQQARLAFVEGVGRCDPEKGPLRPYCISRIRHELQSLAEVSYGIKVPRRSGVPAHVLRAAERIWSKEGREPSPAELNGHAQAYADAASRPRVVTSFDAGGGDGERPSLAELLGDDEPDALELLVERETSTKAAAPAAQSILATVLDPYPRRKVLMESPPRAATPLDTLRNAIRDVQAMLRALDDEEKKIRAQREAIRKELALLAGGAVQTSARPAVLLELGQDSLKHKVMKFLRAHPNARVSAIAEAVGATAEETSNELGKLRSAGTVVSKGKARGTTYSPAARA
jgi:Sigma-70 region 2